MASDARAGRKPARLLVLVLGVAALVTLAAVFLGTRISASQAAPEELSDAELLARVALAADDPPEFGATVTVGIEFTIPKDQPIHILPSARAKPIPYTVSGKTVTDDLPTELPL